MKPPVTRAQAEPNGTAAVFAGFEARELPTSRGTLHARVGGSGPPLLSGHGCPQSHLMWYAAAPLLTDRHTVVVPDLSPSPRRSPSAPDHLPG